jgi:iron complex transport system substrate-binding protein
MLVETKEFYLRIYWLFLLSLTVFIIDGCTASKDKELNPTKRIISLAPHITEIIYALNAEDQLVAVTDFCRYPEEAASKVTIGGFLDPNIEKIVMLKPTHLFGLPSHEKLAQELSKFGLKVTMLRNENVNDALLSIEEIGELLNRKEQAAQLINAMKYTLDSLQVNKANTLIAATLIIGREKETLKNITVAGSNTYIDDLWGIVGGKNSYEDLPARYGAINIESLLLRNPDVIIEFDMTKERGVYQVDLTSEWRFLKNLHAVQNGNVFVIGGNYTLIPGPRLVMLAKDFSKIIDVVKSEQ